MLKIFRKKGVARKVLWGVAVVIIISFGFGLGMSQFGGGVTLDTAAGKVFGQKVSVKDFQNYMTDTRDQAMLMHGENYRKFLPFIDMESETWTRIILLKEAERLAIKVADPEVIAASVIVLPPPI